MNNKKEVLLKTVTLALCVLLFLQRLTGGIWHAVLGLILTVIVVVHMCRQMKKMKYKKKSVQVMDQVLMVSLAAAFVSGILLHPLHGVPAIKILHKLSAVVFVLAVLGHVVQHRRSVRT